MIRNENAKAVFPVEAQIAADRWRGVCDPFVYRVVNSRL
jgi:hypothetical protein